MNSKLNKSLLVQIFAEGCKEKVKWKVGTEHEKFGFKKKSLEPINFLDIQKIFSRLSNKYNWEKIFEDSNLIALKKNNASITLEPGGQVELSGAPMENLFETCKEVNQHQGELDDICQSMGIDFLGMGLLPKWEINKITLMPKKRYKIMSEYMPQVGSKGLDMMLRTATIQANFDFSSESDMVKKMRVSQSLQPIIIALYANSPFIDGKITNYKSFRSFIWTKTDKKRCGTLPFIYENSFSFERYVDYLLDVPMYFIVRDNEYINMTNFTFRNFLEKKVLKNIEPTLEDWKIHLTTVFPEVRLKTFIELRGADGGPWSRVCALPAFWTGILYDQKNLDQIWSKINHWSYLDVQNFYQNVRKDGLNTFTPDGEKLIDFAKKTIDQSSEGLERRSVKSNKRNESIFLEPLTKILESGKSPGEMWEKLFFSEWKNDIDMLYETNYFKVLENEKN
ncbi:MAG: glutamate--cysteine ligase [Pelagibacteraceae bacterium TMED124]|nr:glutamate--cysteine ligase [Rickettsiales bacterium]RPG19518.1 MAG: glutamate--cysteine ligase [Pelagibacteraceae bacterium TMED124]|tara:strand:- start:2964 stop:4316 length:1353 start_codon:yes stop_codon:yes gene_type:complete